MRASLPDDDSFDLRVARHTGLIRALVHPMLLLKAALAAVRIDIV
jgi:hypothetical protein